MENAQFPVDDVVEVVKSVMQEVIQVRDENIGAVTEEWATNIEEKVLWKLSKLNRPLKYIVTCFITQNIGGYLYSAISGSWDNTTDGTCTVRWANSFMYCVVSVFGVAI